MLAIKIRRANRPIVGGEFLYTLILFLSLHVAAYLGVLML